MKTKSDEGGELEKTIEAKEEQLMKLREELAELRRKCPEEPINGKYSFKGSLGETLSLSDLFGDHDELMLVHNMGKTCPYCTLWADGFNGLLKHLENRASFVVTSPDDPATQRRFANERGWKFRMFSAPAAFIKDMGFMDKDGGARPGVSTFRKDSQGRIFRAAHAGFGPGDSYCSLWHLLDLLPKGTKDWEAKFSYYPR